MAVKKANPADVPESERGFVSVRVYDAPRELVWEAWTNPKHIVKWWGPNGFSHTFHEHAVKPGGIWRFTMHGPTGTDWPNRVEYTKVVKNERLEYMHGSDEQPDMFRVTVTFVDKGGKTELTMSQVCATREMFEQLKKFGAEEGGKQHRARLASHLARVLGRQKAKTLTIHRTLSAPRDLVWKAWTDSGMLARWWGPRGFTAPVCKIDPRRGGRIQIDMKSPDGDILPMWGAIHEIDPMSKIVFTSTALEGKLQNLNTVTLVEKSGKTELTLEVEVIQADEEAAFALEGMDQGWSETLDRLVETVSS